MVKRIISWFDENDIEEGHKTYHGDFDDKHAIEYMNRKLDEGCTQIELFEIIPTKLIKAKIEIVGLKNLGKG